MTMRGADSNEGVEIENQRLDLTGWQLLLYNGQWRQPCMVVTSWLGTIPDLYAGFDCSHSRHPDSRMDPTVLQSLTI